MRRGGRVLLLVAFVAFVAVVVMGGCSVLIGVTGDPVVVDDVGEGSIEAGAESGGDSATPGDAASADETDTGDAGDAGDQDADDGAVE